MEKLSQPCVILSGGKSSRMGKNKALLPFGQFLTLAEYQYMRLSAIFDNVYLSCKESAIFDFDANFIEDEEEIFAPTIAISTAFKELYAHEIFFITVDTPFVSQQAIHTIINSKNDQAEAFIAQTPKGTHNLVGLYRESILPTIEALDAVKNYRLSALLDKVETQYITFDDEDEFLNLNTKEEYERALELYKQKTS